MTTLTNAPATPERRKAGVGDAFRSWWNALPRPVQWLVGVPVDHPARAAAGVPAAVRQHPRRPTSAG